MKVVFRSLSPRDVDPLLEFSRRMYGNASYQRRREYLSWLYEANPHARGLSDCMVALVEDTIVGCIHRMALPCLTDDGEGLLLSLQNHVVEPKLRGGVGIMLLQRAASGSPIIFSPGVHGRLADAYRRLKYEEIPSFWFARTLKPVHAAWQLTLSKLSQNRLLAKPLWVREKTPERIAERTKAVADPDPDQLEALAENMQKQARLAGGPRILWTADLVRWRYFHPKGPRHLLVEQVKAGGWAVLSLGRKSGASVARIVEYDDAGDARFMKDVLLIARTAGASVALAYSAQAQFRDRMLASGWRHRKDPPASFAKGTAHLAVSAGAGDLGFEAFGTQVHG